MTQVALALTIALLAVTAYLAWEGREAARGAKEELETFKAMHGANEARAGSAGAVPLPKASAKITPPPIQPTPPPTAAPVVPAPPDELEIMPGAGSLPGGGLTVPKAVAEAEAAGVNTNTLTAAQKQVLAAKPIAKVKTVVKEQGFIVVDGGSKQGIAKGMKLHIRRNAAVLGRATVTDAVEETEAVADLDFSSIPAGVAIEPGDELIQPVGP